MPEGPGRIEAGDRLLHHTVLYSHRAHCHPVVGFLLDRPRGCPRQDLRWSAHRADHYDAAVRVKGTAAQSPLHQGKQKFGCLVFFALEHPTWSTGSKKKKKE